LNLHNENLRVNLMTKRASGKSLHTKKEGPKKKKKKEKNESERGRPSRPKRLWGD